MIAAAQRILHPYTLEVKEVPWWSVYEIGQRVCDKFDDVPEADVGTRAPRVFIAGDACHTHSPKAGQGMNVSMQDLSIWAGNWPASCAGGARREFLHTYSAERQAVAKELIDFDREWAKIVQRSAEGRGRRRRSRRGSEIFRQAGTLHGGDGDPIQAFAPHRRADTSASGERAR